jgi:hypothetical protein
MATPGLLQSHTPPANTLLNRAHCSSLNVVQSGAAAGELGRVEDHDAEPLALGYQPVERLKRVAGLKVNIGHTVELRVGPRQSDRPFARIHGDHFARAAKDRG